MNTLKALPLTGLPFGPGGSLHGLAGTDAVIAYTVFGCTAPVDGEFIPKLLAQGLLGTSDGLMFAPQHGNIAILSQINLTNASASSVAGIALGVNGSSATAGNQLLSSLTIPANGLATLCDGILRVYDATGSIQSTAAFPFDSTAAAVTTPLAASTAGTALTAAHRDHTHQSPGGIASIVAASAAIVNVEAQVVGATVPANLMQAGTTFRVTFGGKVTTLTSPGNLVLKVRLGTTTLTGNIAATITAALTASITGQNFFGQFLVTVRTAGASGTVVGQGVVHGTNVSTGAFTTLNVVGITTSSVALDTTAIKIVELTAVTGAADASVTVENASVAVEKM